MSEPITDWDTAYNNSASIPGAEDFLERWPIQANEFRKSVNCQLDIPYGESERNRYDLFHPDGESKGLFVFVHGGYWIRFDKSFWSQLAAGPLSNGWTVAMPSYNLCPDVSVRDITKEVATAVNTMAQAVDGPIVLSGHSAGGHLVAQQVCEYSQLPESVLNRIRRVITISGVHDLRPLLKVGYNESIRLDKELTLTESPALQSPVKNAKIDCIVGGDELAEFRRQNDLLANIWHGLGAQTSSHHVEGKHHFDVIEDLKNPSGLICGLAEEE